MKGWLEALVRLFFPRHCVVCGDCLQQGEDVLCMRCSIDMPRTGFHLHRDNEVERMFWGKLPLERASAYFYYSKGSNYRGILHQLKYNGRHDVGEAMGRFMAAELQASGFFEGIDVLVPVPLHRRKQKARGYNQSEYIARGIAQVTGIGGRQHCGGTIEKHGHADPQIGLRTVGECEGNICAAPSRTFYRQTSVACGRRADHRSHLDGLRRCLYARSGHTHQHIGLGLGPVREGHKAKSARFRGSEPTALRLGLEPRTL